MTANVNVTKVLFRRGNTAQNAAYTGINGEVTVDTQAFTLRIHDGSTVGGTVINAGGVAGSYSNTNTAAYLASQNITSANIGGSQTFANANAAVQATAINLLNANIGAYQTYANANAAAQTVSIENINANLGAYQTYANANSAAQSINIDTINANVGSFQVYANANAATQATTINTINANLGAFQNYANATFGTSSYANANVKSYLAAFDGNILPSANVTYSLGDATHQWKDLWVSNNTIYIGNTPIRVDGGTLLVNNAPISGAYTNLIENGDSNVTIAMPNGDITVSANNQIWTFGTDGNLTLPGGGNIDGSGYGISLIASNDGVATAGTVNITTVNPAIGESFNWQFNSLGELELPQGGLIKEGGGPFGSSITLEPANIADGDQTLVIYPTAGEGNHLHLTTGNLYNTEMYLGSDDYYVKLTNSGTIAINANDNTSSQATWEFMPLGDLRLPQGGVISEVSNPSGFPGYSLAFTPDPANAINPNQQLLVYPTGGADFNHLHLTSGDLYDTELFLGNDNLHVKLANTGNVEIRADDNAGNTALWIFNKDSTTTFPNGLYFAPMGEIYNISGTASFGSSNYDVNIIANVNGTSQQFNFGVDGSLTIPTGGNLIFDSSAVSVIDGVSSVTTGNIITTNGVYWANGAAYSTGSGTYGNAQVAEYLANYDGTINFTASPATINTGEITAANVKSTNGYFYGNGVNILSGFASTSYVDTKISDLVDNAPALLDTLGEIAANLAVEANVTGSILNSITNTNANVTAANVNISALQSNAGSQQTSIDLLSSRVDQAVTLTSSPQFAGLTTTANVNMTANVRIHQNLVVDGNINFIGNVTQTNITTANAVFTGDSSGFGALYAGVIGYTPLPYTVIQATADYNDYSQINFQNLNLSANASTEWVATAGNGTDLTNYIDFGIAGGAWDGTQLNSVGTAAKANDGWIYIQGNATAGTGGNLVVGTIQPGKRVNILTGGSGSANIYSYFNSTGLTTANVYAANYLYANGVSILTGIGGTYSNVNVEAYIGGNIGAYQTFANANAATQATSINSINANIGAYQTYANANVVAIQANLGAFQTFSNTNAATQATSINNINANIGAYQTYANANVVAIQANLGAFQTYANNTFGGSSYGNASVAAYLPTYTGNIAAGNVTVVSTVTAANIVTTGTYGNITGANVISANTFVFGANGVNILTAVAGGATDNELRANVGAYQIFANANAAAQSTSIDTVNANIGAYQIFANANAATQSTSINTINANIGAYQIFANANSSAQASSIDTINANIGSYQTFANANAATQATSINTINANLGSFQTYANATFGTSSYGNANVAAYLPTYTGIVAASRAQVTNSVDFMYGGFPYMGWQLDGSDTLKLRTNIASGDYTNDAILVNRQSLEVNVVAQLTAGNVITNNGVYWANGAAYSTGGGATDRLTNGNSQVILQANGVTTFGNTATISNNGEFRLWADNDITVYRNGRDGYGVAENEVKVFADNGHITSTTPNGLEIKQGNLVIPNNKGIFYANGVAYSTGGGGTYGNTEVAAYLVANPQPGTYSNVNVEAYIGGNIGAYQTFANANVSSIQNQIFASNANIGAFQTYANATFGVSSYGNTQVAAYLTGNIIAGNINATQYNFANGVNILSTVGAGTYGNTEVAAYLMTWPNADINILDTTTANITTLRANNFSTANAVISGGYISALTNASIITSTVVTQNITGGNVTTLRATNLGTGNAVISGGYISALTNASIITSTVVTQNITNGNATTLVATNFSTGNAVINGGYISSMANATVTGNVTAGNLIGFSSNTSIVAGAYTTNFLTNGMATVGGNVSTTGNVTANGIAPFYAPNRPAFRVYGFGTTNNLTTTQNTNGVLNNNNWAVDYEQGSYLNGTTGVFTAPAAGLYQISVIGRNSGYTSGISQLVCVKNYAGSSQVLTMLEFASNSSMNHAGTSTVARLVAGDTLAIRVTAGEINFDVNDSWSVTYIG